MNVNYKEKVDHLFSSLAVNGRMKRKSIVGWENFFRVYIAAAGKSTSGGPYGACERSMGAEKVLFTEDR